MAGPAGTHPPRNPLVRHRVERGVAVLTLNRPEKRNAFAGTMREELLQALHAAHRDAAARTVVIHGAGKGFCAGGDLRALAKARESGDEAAFRRVLERGREIVLAIRDLPKPVVAAVHGAAAGAGCNLALACDVCLASEDATFLEPFARLGMHPDWGGSWLLPRRVGLGRALWMAWTAEAVDARRAETWGLVDLVVPAGRALEEALALARSLAKGPPRALAAIKASFREGLESGPARATAREVEAALRCFRSEDMREGVRAFLEKRPARFRGR